MAASPIPTPQIAEIFKNSTWQAQAEHPDTLDQLGPKWREFLAGKGQGLKASLNFSQFVGGQSGQNM